MKTKALIVSLLALGLASPALGGTACLGGPAGCVDVVIWNNSPFTIGLQGFVSYSSTVTPPYLSNISANQAPDYALITTNNAGYWFFDLGGFYNGATEACQYELSVSPSFTGQCQSISAIAFANNGSPTCIGQVSVTQPSGPPNCTGGAIEVEFKYP